MYALGCLGAGGMIVIMLANKFLPIVEHHEEAHEDKPAEAAAGAWSGLTSVFCSGSSGKLRPESLVGRGSTHTDGREPIQRVFLREPAAPTV